MASTRERAGKTTVEWRVAGTGKQTTATFDTAGALGEAGTGWRAFKAELEAQNHPDMPVGWKRVGRKVVRHEDSVTGGNITLVAYARKFAEMKDWSPGTKRDALRVINDYVEPYFKRKAIADIRWEELAAFQNTLSAKLSPATVVTYRGLALTPVFRHALRANVIARNPMELVEAPKREAPEINVLSPEEFEIFSRAADEIDREIAAHGVDPDPAFYDAVITLGFTGMRIQELCNLEVGSYRPARGTAGPKLIAGVKTEAGKNRPIPLTDFLAEILQARTDAALARGERYLFPAAKGGKQRPTSFRHRWVRCLKKAEELGLVLPARSPKKSGKQSTPLTPHMLRHGLVTWLVDSGESVKRVSKLIGHTKVETTLGVYTHATKGRADDQLVETIGAHYRPINRKPRLRVVA